VKGRASPLTCLFNPTEINGMNKFLKILNAVLLLLLISSCADDASEQTGWKDASSESIDSQLREWNEQGGPSCLSLPRNVIEFDELKVHLNTLECPDEVAYQGHKWVEQEIRISDGTGTELFVLRGDEVNLIVNTKLPSLVFHYVKSSSSNVYHAIYGFDTTPTLVQKFIIEKPVREDESDWKIKGFYESDGVAMIDRLRVKDEDVCNACREYVVESLAIVDGIVEVRTVK